MVFGMKESIFVQGFQKNAAFERLWTPDIRVLLIFSSTSRPHAPKPPHFLKGSVYLFNPAKRHQKTFLGGVWAFALEICDFEGQREWVDGFVCIKLVLVLLLGFQGAI